MIRRIQELLYEEGYTIAGAKKKLETEIAGGELEAAAEGAEAAVEEDEAEEEEAAGADSERLRRLESGLRAALAEARQILALLD